MHITTKLVSEPKRRLIIHITPSHVACVVFLLFSQAKKKKKPDFTKTLYFWTVDS